MKKILLVLAILFLSEITNAQSYDVKEYSMSEETVYSSVYEFKEDGVFILNGVVGEYINYGLAYTASEMGGDVVKFIKNYLTILGCRMSINNFEEYNFYLIYGLLKQS